MSALDLLPSPSSCPFCGEHNAQLFHRASTNEDGTRGFFEWRMKCWHCKAEGPAHYLPGEAYHAWEIRFPRRPHPGNLPPEDGGGGPVEPRPVTPQTPEPVE